MSKLTAISPIDGRYQKQTASLSAYFSEFGLIKYRVLVEIHYFLFLADKKFFKVTPALRKALLGVVENFSEADAEKIKTIEATTNHDVKAVEYFLKEVLDSNKASELKEWIHFGLTSQDINNTAIPLSWKEAMENNVLPAYINLQNNLFQLAKKWKKVSLLARTHGQAASPTTLGKEFKVFTVRLRGQLTQLKAVPHSAKFGGATGNFNAHTVAYPGRDWHRWGDTFVNKSLGLQRSYPTTQIEHYDNIAAQFDALKRIDNIFIDLCRDVWTYVSMDYFKQKIKAGEVGSSAMPHKVNPIDFENAEGNLGLANALFEHLAGKLPISRLQRDLTDSTVLRNVGVPFGHLLIAIASMSKGLGKLLVNEAKIASDLEANWAVVAEAIQNILRREGYPKPYEALKALTRTNSAITASSIADFIDTLDVNDAIKAELKQITPSNYIGQVKS